MTPTRKAVTKSHLLALTISPFEALRSIQKEDLMASPENIEQYRDEIPADLELAERIHRSMIPQNGRRGDLEIACSFIPMIGVGGDYASVFFQSDNKVMVSVCDVSGHGIAAALLASRVNSFVLSQAPALRHPCQMGESLNRFLFEFFRETSLLVSFYCLYLDLKDHSLTYAGFGHPPVFLFSKSTQTIKRLDSENTLIGVTEEFVQLCSMLTIPFEPGDRLILYTDGITESENQLGKQFEIEQLQGLVSESAHLSAKEQVDTITDRVEQFREGLDPQDDQLLLAVSFVED
jgi:serine phosphatase RsbU (regulator of sigma subunit)